MSVSDIDTLFPAIREKMKQRGVCEEAINAFRKNYSKLLAGDTGLIAEEGIEAVAEVPNYSELSKYKSSGNSALGKLAIIKLNGGLGTSMGLERAKSLIRAHQNFTFLDIIIAQTRFLRSTCKNKVPLLFMNSFRTESDTQAVIDGCVGIEDGQGKIPFSFVQNQVPKIKVSDFTAVDCPNDPELEWCPPGHGDIYTALWQNKLVDKLLAEGIEYAFISNSDNLGAVVDPVLLGYLVKEKLPFVMEVAARTEADKKGGHLAQSKETGGLLLRESAQCPPSEVESFQDVEKYSFFNTNSLWISLKALQELMKSSAGVLDLPLIRNKKTADPREVHSTEVYQLENAMGAAIALFEGARAVCVPRARFAPVKTTDDLLPVRSDAYELSPSFQVQPSRARVQDALLVKLDPRYYRTVESFEERFPAGSPSLVQCERFEVEGDVRFGSGVVCKGRVLVRNSTSQQIEITDGAMLSGEHVFS